MNFFKNRLLCVFLVLLVICGNPIYAMGLSNTSVGDLNPYLTNTINKLHDDMVFTHDLFNNKLSYVDPTGGETSNPLTNNETLVVYSNIKDAVAHSNPGDTIFLGEGNYSGENNTGITIQHDLNIIGLSPIPEKINDTINNITNETIDDLINNTNDTGIIIDGEGKNSFFNVLGSSCVTLGNLTLVNGYSNGDGGAIKNKGDLLISTTFIRNSTCKSDRFAERDSNGGAIYNNGVLKMDYVTCEGNNAPGYSRGGSIFNTGTMNISNSVFLNNTGTSGGGAIYSSTTQRESEVYNCFFAYNKAGSESGESGGAIYNENNRLNVVLSTFVNNTGDNGGAIDTHNTVLRLDWNDFVFNKAVCDGGAVRIRNGEKVSVSDCNFANNTAGNGAGLYFSDGEELNINDSSFVENFALGDGGGISLKKGKLTLNQTSVTHNICFGRGGGIYNYDSDVLLNNLSIMFNVGTNGAGLYTTGDHRRSVDLEYGIFSYNFCSGDGGAVYADTNSHFTVHHGVFSANGAQNGGGIFSRNNLLIDNGSFINNTADGDGAGLNLQGQNSEIRGSLFDENSAGGSGGAIYSRSDFIDCHDSLFYGNSAEGDGGGVVVNSGCNSFYHDQFENNRCGGYGGAVFANAYTSFPTSLNDFRGNTAGKDADDFIDLGDKKSKANAGIIGFAISAFLIAVIATVATIATCGAAGVPMASGLGFLIGLGIGLVSSGVEYGVTELIATVNKEFDDYRKEHPGIMTGIGIAMNIAGMIAGYGVAHLISRYYTGTFAKLLTTGLGLVAPDKQSGNLIPSRGERWHPSDEEFEIIRTQLVDAFTSKDVMDNVFRPISNLLGDEAILMPAGMNIDDINFMTYFFRNIIDHLIGIGPTTVEMSTVSRFIGIFLNEDILALVNSATQSNISTILDNIVMKIISLIDQYFII